MTPLAAALLPLLAAVAPIVMLCAHNVEQLSLVPVAIAVSAALALGGLVHGAWAFLWRERTRASLAASVFCLIFLSYGHLFDALQDTLSSHALVHALTSLTALLVLAAAVAGLALTRRELGQLHATVRLALGLLVGMGALQLLAGILGPAAAHVVDAELEADKARYSPAPRLAQDDAAHPDVYYIVLDGYARADVLRALYGFDNSPFISFLEERGFYVAKKSHANYAMTFLSLSSTLNLRYLDALAGQLPPKSKDRHEFYRILRDALVPRMMQASGYTYVHLNTNYAGTEVADRADRTYAAQPRWLQGELPSAILRTTALNFLEPSVADMHLYMLGKLPEVAALPEPTFTVAHLLLPHNPYVFDRSGNVQRDVSSSLQWRQKTGGWGNRSGYVEQLEYLNGRVQEIVDRVLRDSKVPPIIILASDHGSATTFTSQKDEAELRRFARERLPNLMAVLAPEAMRSQLYPEVTPVNVFRLLVTTLLGVSYPPLEDRLLMSWYKRPYAFLDVTASLAEAQAAQP